MMPKSLMYKLVLKSTGFVIAESKRDGATAARNTQYANLDQHTQINDRSILRKRITP